MSLSLVIPAGELDICLNISINISQKSSISDWQFFLVLNITNGTLAVPGMNDSITFTIPNAVEHHEQDKNNGTSYLLRFSSK